ncbi:MAG: VWA domain-containing protein [SAR324 cluster bacterium]|nr:VWA domain-containing protein [SAR324 cluster bacterium]
MTNETEPGHLLRNMLLFGRLLRSLGVNITPTQILDLVEGLDHLKIRKREDFKNGARTILISKHEHISLFDRAFDLFWQARDQGALLDLDMRVLVPPQQTEKKKILEIAPASDEEKDLPDRESDEPLIDTVYTYSAREILKQKDFADLSPEEMHEIKLLIQSMNWQLEQRRTRRKTADSRGVYLDMRRTFRGNLHFGGEPLKLAWKSRKLKRRPLVVISDISGSMERYSRVLLKFIYAISNGLDHVESFVFSTRLTRVTRQLRGRDIDSALDEAIAAIHDWAGGTRIGEALKTFNYQWGRRVLGQGAIVIVISDGWDRGDPQLLSHELNRLQLSCQRLIWLNPLLGAENYEPLTRGIQAALPFIDDFLPIHNLSSLEQLGSLLERLGEHKPTRHQHAEIQ